MINSKNLLIVILVLIAVIVTISNLIEQELSTTISNLMYIPITFTFVTMGILVCIKNRLVGNLGKGWLLFAITAILWTVAEVLWIIYELVYKIEPWPSPADFFWLVGYPLYFGFLLFYLKPFRKAISEKTIVVSVLISIGLIIPSSLIAYESGQTENISEVLLGLSYPISDAIILIPSIIGISLFLKGKVNIFWTFTCIGIVLFVVSDTLFLLTYFDDSYYSGYPFEILYFWGYVILTFGVYEHQRMFSKNNKRFSVIS